MTRIAVLDKSKCSPQKCGDWLCVRLCPVNKTGTECILEGEDKKAHIIEETCIGCNICENRCPFNAISIINLPEELKAAPIHRYGDNGFALYRIPIPRFGQVVGILGRNGIGKTTALQILAGILKPNLGEDKEAGYDEVINFFKGTEAQNYLEMLRDKSITIAYKPQRVDDIPKQFNGKVIELLKKVDEKNELDKIAKELEIENILDHDIKVISGGELQRVAIAATVLKKANVLYFDEPTSYLDIQQRLKIAKFIRSLANEETAILVVEHDLIILDYMTDIVHLMYGKAGGYGVVSQPMTTKLGINTYLDGYLRSENVRFRDKKISFIERAPLKNVSSLGLTEWPSFTKKQGQFLLEAKEGAINRYETLGILGKNGIGKTTFVKILAGVLEHDKGKVDMKLKVAYKPQYLEIESDESVGSILANAVKDYKAQIIAPLEIEGLLIKKVGELSGGELQRVAIALCLSQDADIYLLDEPSAYLDVEQRLNASKVINNIIETSGKAALVVDHDILFIDYLAKKLMVFDGEPAVHGTVKPPLTMEEGMNKLLKELEITLRRDRESQRPRINKEGSVKDREQKRESKYYYS